MPDTAANTAELIELLKFLHDWLAADQTARKSLDRFIDHPSYTNQDIRTDLIRFTLLLGGYSEHPYHNDEP
jgi:hypothetical protein